MGQALTHPNRLNVALFAQGLSSPLSLGSSSMSRGCRLRPFDQAVSGVALFVDEKVAKALKSVLPA